LLGALVLFAIAAASVLAPWIAPYDPRATTGRPFDAPSAAHWLGTNDVGQDLFSELLWGGRVSLAIGLLAAAVGTALGGGAGLASGYYRGRVDAAISRLAEVVLVLPFLPLMILLAAYVGPNVVTLAVVIGVLVWARPARVIRSAVLTEVGREHVIAARALGAGHRRVLWRHVAPAVLSLLVAELVQLASRAILLEASLAFLGLGDPVRKSWGTTLYYAQARGAFLSGSWVWWVLPAGVLITLSVFALALVGFELDRAANPRLRSR
jgi:peptide/nickel transport system ATP-binding protein/peptide/nickel transport system permease protein